MSRWLTRTAAIAGKEWLHVSREPRTVILALVMPVVLLLIFGYGVSFDLDRVPLAVVDTDRTPQSREVARRVTAGRDFLLVAEPTDAAEVELLFRRNLAAAALVIPRGFGDALARGDRPSVQLLVDGSDSNTANLIVARLEGSLPRLVIEASGRSLPPAPVSVKARTFFNPENKSAFMLVPGLAAYVLAIVAVVLTALAVAREWEEGSMEQLFATPVGRLEIVVGKLLPYLGLAAGAVTLVLGAGHVVFGVPFRGSILMVAFAAFLFILAMLGQGLLISVITRNQMVATQAGTLSAMLPSMLLSGFIFPIANMPPPLQVVSHLVPARYFIACLRGALLRGVGLAELWPQLLALLLFALAMIALSAARFRRRLA